MHLNLCFLFVLICQLYIIKISAISISSLNLIKSTYPSSTYRQLLVTGSDSAALTVQPFARLNLTEFKLNSFCNENIRTQQTFLEFPVLFWNDEYMNDIKKNLFNSDNIKPSEQILNFTNSFILPPSYIVAYRINWRRKLLNTKIESYIIPDSTWYDSRNSIVLPKSQKFILEFSLNKEKEINENNNSQKIMKNCENFRKIIINQYKSQLQEFVVEFLRKEENRTNYKLFIKVGDLRSLDLFQKLKCPSYNSENCYISFDYADEFAKQLSLKFIRKNGLFQLNIAQDISKKVKSYLCGIQVAYNSVNSKYLNIMKSVDAKVCQLPSYVYATRSNYPYSGNYIDYPIVNVTGTYSDKVETFSIILEAI